MKDLGITKGEIIIDTDMGYAFDLVLKGKEEEQVYMPLLDRHCVGEKEMTANANLFADAHNTAQKCGLLPSELLKQRDTIYVLAMDFISEVIKGTGADRAGGYAIKIEAAIKSTEQ